MAKRANDIERDVIASRYPPIEMDRMKYRRLDEFDIAFFEQLARQRGNQRFPYFDAPAGQMPTGCIAVLDQEDTAFAIENGGPDADRKAA